MSYETEMKEFEMRRDMDILEIFSDTCQREKERKRGKGKIRCNDTYYDTKASFNLCF